jgi:hypothetical protein
MRRARTILAAALFATSAVVLPVVTRAAEARLPVDTNSPAALVRGALESELLGPSEVRSELLKQALARDPDYAPARWQSGFVRWDGKWLTPSEVASRTAHDPLLAEYRKRRDAMVDKADDHRELAAWCHKNKLFEQARLHWLKVLEFEPTDQQALSGLGVQWYEGRLLTAAQIEQGKKAAVELRRANKAWQARANKWRAAIDHGPAGQRETALAELKKVSDVSALPALEAAFGIGRQTQKALELNHLLMQTVGRIPGAESTRVLLRRALTADSEEVRAAAADELKKRPMHAYVPQLIAALPGSLSTRFQISILPNGAVVHEHQVLIEGREANISLRLEVAANSDIADPLALMFNVQAATARDLRNAARIESQARATQARLDDWRDRVQFVLERTTGFAKVSDPGLWEKQYNDYNGWRTTQTAKPTYYQNQSEQSGYAVAPTTTVLTSAPPPPHSCFAAGTPVLTQLGMVAIEKIKPGDLVLAQDSETGELAYKPVQATTLLPATPLLKITTGTDSVVTTPGHPYWVYGEGWQTAKHLAIGSRLHSLNGGVAIDRIEEVRPAEVYNLVVDGFHNYFAGPARLSAHDNSPLIESAVGVPGLVAATR